MADVSPVPVGPTDRQWAQLAQQAKVDALSDIRASAGKWGGTIASLTGIFSVIALIKGRTDITALVTWAQVLIAVLLLLAVTLAFAAILLAAFAAQGIPVKSIAVNNPRAYQQQYEDQAETAATQLHWSRYLVAPATALLAVAIGVTWFAPTSTPTGPTVLITEKSGAVFCGSLATNATSGMVLLQPGVVSTRLIPIGAVASITTVSGCH
ncbi:MAG: hypothetical protein M3Z66_22810 [Chloroflexota bacterium]|nr:hypothetical protein [Chloroflexota bacterium]